jgi:hypothetical protein
METEFSPGQAHATAPDAESNRPKARRWLRFLSAAHVIAALLLYVTRLVSPREPFVIGGLSVCVSQAALLGLWFGFGRSRSPRRLLLCLLPLATELYVLTFGVYGEWGMTGRLAIELTVVLTAAFTAITLAALIMRRIGLDIGFAARRSVDIPPARLQFTTIDLFLFTTIVAMMVSIITALRRSLPAHFEVDLILILTLGELGTLAPVLFVALSRARGVWRLLAAPAIALAALPFYLATGDWFLPLVIMGQAAISIVSLLVLRHIGYRVYVRQQRPMVV